ncbi:ABC transporter permease [Arthrobacter sp. MA-N2]|uniref:ABC transporter permease n=1 Tax=Arthrobacter sp. MA-N2 TaxID=1101188 RepID=UPI0004ACA322|nr:ABC transporter permease subunit [Arthrobacter sp. MA-N2]
MKVLSKVSPLLVSAAAIAIWWALSASSTSLYFPPLENIVVAFRDNWLSTNLVDQAIPSVLRILLGMALAILIGVVAGVVVGMFRKVEPFARPELEFMRALPPILVIPPLLLVLGTGDLMKIAVIAASAVWPILLATTDGVRAVEPVRADMGLAFRLPWGARMRWIVLPTAVPHIWSGVRAAVPIAIVVMVAAEYYSSVNGIGYFISRTSTTFRLDEMWSAILLLGFLGVLLNSCVALVGHWLDRKYGEFGIDA